MADRSGGATPRRRAVGLGAGGHAVSVLDAILARGELDVVGLLDPRPELRGTTVLGIPVLGADDLLGDLRSDGVACAVVCVGSVGPTAGRRRVYEMLGARGFDIATVVHPSASVSAHARLGDGATVLALAVVNAGARLGANVLINSGAIVEHDCEIGDHVHVATGALLGGAVRIGAGCHIGIGAIIRQGIEIGTDAIVGAGAVVVHNVERGTVVAGVPARPLRKEGR